MAFPVVYDRATECTGGPTPGAKALMGFCLVRWETAKSLGIYNCRRVRGGLVRSVHSEGRAIDVGFPRVDGGTVEGWECAIDLVDHHVELGIQQVIYARKVWRNTRMDAGWRPYRGVHNHNDHIHAELTRQAASELTAAMILDVFADEEVEMQPWVMEKDFMLALELKYLSTTGPNPREMRTEDRRSWLELFREKGDPAHLLASAEWLLANEEKKE